MISLGIANTGWPCFMLWHGLPIVCRCVYSRVLMAMENGSICISTLHYVYSSAINMKLYGGPGGDNPSLMAQTACNGFSRLSKDPLQAVLMHVQPLGRHIHSPMLAGHVVVSGSTGGFVSCSNTFTVVAPACADMWPRHEGAMHPWALRAHGCIA